MHMKEKEEQESHQLSCSLPGLHLLWHVPKFVPDRHAPKHVLARNAPKHVLARHAPKHVLARHMFLGNWCAAARSSEQRVTTQKRPTNQSVVLIDCNPNKKFGQVQLWAEGQLSEQRAPIGFALRLGHRDIMRHSLVRCG